MWKVKFAEKALSQSNGKMRDCETKVLGSYWGEMFLLYNSIT